MSPQDDSNQAWALGAVAGIVSLVLAGVIALAVATPLRSPATAVLSTQAREGRLGPAEHLYFEPGSDLLPTGAQEVLLRVADVVRGGLGSSVLISGYHDASGDPQLNADLARRRALAVRHALEADGVDPHLLVMATPQRTTDGADAREARRVEIRVR